MALGLPPALVRRVVFPLHERLKGKRTHHRLRELEASQWLSPAALRELQFRRLSAHLAFAYRHVPYYTRLLDEHELPPGRVQSFEDFARIPYLTKEIIRRNFDALTARPQRRRVQRMTTGGSTGSPVAFLVDAERTSGTDAARLRAQRWQGVDMGDREIVLWGSPIELGRQDRVRTARDWCLNSRLLSAFDLGEPALARYADVVARFQPRKIYGYASAIAVFAGYLRRSGRAATLPRPAVAFVTAEPLLAGQRETIESALGCRVAVEYGARDAGLIAGECAAGGLHVHAEGMVTELVPAAADGAQRGELVVTNLDSLAMPLIRYRTGDIAAPGPSACACGRGLPLLARVEGRSTDFVVTPEGRVLHAMAVIYILRDEPTVREFQVVQERIDSVVVLVVPDDGFTDATADRIAGALQRLLGAATSVEVRRTEAIARPASGKHRHVVSSVAEASLTNALQPAVRPNSVTPPGSAGRRPAGEP